MNPPCRLAYLVSQYPAISHTFILREVLGLRARGFAISVASVNPPDRLPEKLTAEERREAKATWYLKPQGAAGALKALGRTLLRRPTALVRGLWFALRLGGTDGKKLGYQLAYWAEAIMIGDWMHRDGLSHLHVHFATPASMVGLIASKIFPIGFSFTVHGPDEFYDAPGYRLADKIAGADFVVCISHYARSQLMKLSPVTHWNKFEVCRLGVDPARFAPREAKVAGAVFELLCVGRLVPAKGQHILLEALARLFARGRRVHLTLVGQGPDRPSLETHARRLELGDAVDFTGAVNQDEITGYYSAADAFVLPSFAEGLPVVLMEAMALGVPCITTHITGVPELIRDGIEGLLVAPSDVEGLATAIERLMDDPALGMRLTEAGRTKVLAEYDLNASIARLAAAFERWLSPS
ncbi:MULTISPECIES: glycosyltransferase family 4 protein [Methylococcus]|uniref:Glycosyltransferase family 4 protein n=1 Tax=Methylococcus capsulatus TaxID=414 RepID=A0ABZ2F418_METCP|nr:MULTISPECIES: glycosyltransferase family 4 protein [Methylococcus]MDF9391631.1 colanic acid biosynthesis glycosyltransferase WcaL [Methylococcus capsulatus]